jgi:hypothetical protein
MDWHVRWLEAVAVGCEHHGKVMSLPKTPAGHPNLVRPIDPRRGRRVNRLSLISRNWEESRPGSSVPQKARPTGQKVCFGRTTSHHAESMRVYGTFHTNVAKDRLSSTPFVSMVQAAYLSNGNDTALLWSIDGSRLRGVFRQG